MKVLLYIKIKKSLIKKVGCALSPSFSKRMEKAMGRNETSVGSKKHK